MCPERSGLISICILWNIIYGAVKSNEGAWSERWRLSSGKAASSSLAVLGAEGNLEAAFSPFKGRHSEDSTFSFQPRCRQDFCPMFLSQAVMLLGRYSRGAVVRLLHAELVSKPQLTVPGSSCGRSTALGWVPAPCWAVKSGWECFSPLCAFPASRARSRAGLWPGSPFHGRCAAPGVCRAVWFGTALSCSSLISPQSHSHVHKPGAPPPFPSVEPAWEDRRCWAPAKGLQGREGGSSPSPSMAEGLTWEQKGG